MTLTAKLLSRTFLALGGLALPSSVVSAQEQDVDLELVLAVDVSRSMDFTEQQLQKDGYIAALQHPEVLAAINAGLLGKIAVTYVEWAGAGAQQVIASWALIEDAQSAALFAREISAAQASHIRRTSISGALNFASGLFDSNGFNGMRRVIDVSGDGPNNAGSPVLPVRQAVVDSGITINGLPIMIHEDRFSGYSIANLDVYYEDCVIGGPGAFLVTVDSIERIAEAIRRKLVLEIAGAPARIVPAQFAEERPQMDCLIGEKLWQRRMDRWR
jgi:hypothetical protein